MFKASLTVETAAGCHSRSQQHAGCCNTRHLSFIYSRSVPSLHLPQSPTDVKQLGGEAERELLRLNIEKKKDFVFVAYLHLLWLVGLWIPTLAAECGWIVKPREEKVDNVSLTLFRDSFVVPILVVSHLVLHILHRIDIMHLFVVDLHFIGILCLYKSFWSTLLLFFLWLLCVCLMPLWSFRISRPLLCVSVWSCCI